MKITFISLATLLLTTVSPAQAANHPSVLPIPSHLHTPLLRSQSSPQQAEADRLLEQGIQQWRTSQYQASIESLQQALILYREINNQPKQVQALRNLGNVYYLLSSYEQAIAYYQQSFDLAKRIHDTEGEAGALGNLGVVAAGLGNYRKAGEYYEQALPLYRQVKDRLGEGQTLGNLAEVAYGSGDYTGAIAYLQQTIAISKELKDRQLEASSLGMLGVVYYSTNDYAQSIEYHQQHLAIARSLQDRRGEAAAINNLGNTYHALGDYGKAIEYLEQRLVLAKETQDRLGEAEALKNLSSVYYDLGNFNKAIENAFNGLAIARSIKNPTAEASILTNLGNLYLVVRDFPNAIESHQRRLTLAQELNDPIGAGLALNNLGNVYKTMGQYPKAIEFHQQALEVGRKFKDQGQISSALVNLGVEYDDLGQYAKAIDYHRQALAIARQIEDHPTEGLILNNLGNSLFKSGKLAESESTLFAGLKVWESLWGSLGGNDLNKVSFFDQQSRTYRLLQRVLVAQNKTNQALEISERGRARAFVELLSRRLSSQAANNQTLEIPPPPISQLQQIAKAQNSTLVEYSITYEDVLVNGKAEGKETELYIWAIAPNGTITFRKVNLQPLWQQQNTSLSELVASNREDLGVRGRGLGDFASVEVRQTNTFRQTQLYQLLIHPIADVLPRDPEARITFIPQGALFLVPFAALPDPSGKYLIERHTILTAPSIQVLELTRQQRIKGQEREKTDGNAYTALVVGNPTMPTLPAQFNQQQPAEQLPPLPGAEWEANAIAPLLNTHALTGNRATKSAIINLMPRQRFIHLATHGLLDDFKGSGVPGAIALAPSKNDSGLLTANEILDLKLTAELVVLSACDTGRGRITADGVIGLSRSFITAGVPSIVVSLWSVPDSPTASLMTKFYQSLQHHSDKAQALRQAMLATMQHYPNPRDWAAFTLIGEAE